MTLGSLGSSKVFTRCGFKPRADRRQPASGGTTDLKPPASGSKATRHLLRGHQSQCCRKHRQQPGVVHLSHPHDVAPATRKLRLQDVRGDQHDLEPFAMTLSEMSLSEAMRSSIKRPVTVRIPGLAPLTNRSKLFNSTAFNVHRACTTPRTALSSTRISTPMAMRS